MMHLLDVISNMPLHYMDVAILKATRSYAAQVVRHTKNKKIQPKQLQHFSYVISHAP